MIHRNTTHYNRIFYSIIFLLFFFCLLPMQTLAAHKTDAQKITGFLQKHGYSKKKQKTHQRYDSCRIVVKTDSVDDSFGAIDQIALPSYEEVILQYNSPKETQKAFHKLKQRYGDACYVDEILTLADSTSIMEDSSLYSWGYSYMGMEHMFTEVPDENHITVAIIDTGCDMSNWYFDQDRFQGDSYDFAENDTFPQDESGNGHGTHVTGIVSVCTGKQVDLMILKVFDQYGRTSQLLVDTAIRYATDHHADIINLSIGKTLDPGATEHCWDEAIEQAHQQGILICCASGNKGQSGYSVDRFYPACREDIITVGAIDRDETCASFTSVGAQIDFMAPGVGIVSAKASDTSGLVTAMSGTSMACPHVSAAFAMLKLHNPDLRGQELYEEMLLYTKDLGEPGRDSVFGQGSIHFTCMHKFETITEAATAKTAGYTCLRCSRCEYEKEKYILPPISRIKLNTTSYTYTGKTIRPALTVLDKNGRIISSKYYKISYRNNTKVGTANISIVFSGLYSGSLTTSFKIIPRTPTQIKITKPSSRSRRVYWKQKGKVSGFQIQYALNKSFSRSPKKITIKSSTTLKKKITSLKKKKYYFRIRSYSKVSGTNYYSNWSKCYSK